MSTESSSELKTKFTNFIALLHKIPVLQQNSKLNALTMLLHMDDNYMKYIMAKMLKPLGPALASMDEECVVKYLQEMVGLSDVEVRMAQNQINAEDKAELWAFAHYFYTACL